MKNTRLSLSILLTGALLASAPGVRAHGGEKHGEEKGPAAETSGAGAVISSRGGMTAIYAHLNALQGQLDSAILDKVHGHAIAIDSAAKDLDQDPKLDAARKKRVQGYVKNIAKLADAMHDAADGKKLAETRKAFGKLRMQVDLLDKQFAHSRKPGAKGPPDSPSSDSME